LKNNLFTHETGTVTIHSMSPCLEVPWWQGIGYWSQVHGSKSSP